MEQIISVEKVISTKGYVGQHSGSALYEQPNISVIFATVGRPDVLKWAIKAIHNQTVKPLEIIISCVSPSDHENIDTSENCNIILGKAGLPAQRNAGLRQVSPFSDIIVFFDDDFIAHEAWLEEITKIFDRYYNVDSVTGTVIADGIKGIGYTETEAWNFLNAYSYPKASNLIAKDYSPYGCNMAFRAKSIKDLKFDERLVLYGWQEDRDFGSQVANRGGRLVKASRAFGVHLGVKKSRSSGRRLGYSQIINPAYMFKKGTMPLLVVLDHVIGNVLSNFFRSLYPETYIDRIGRLKGNIIGFGDLIRGRLTPERAEKL